MSTRTRHLLPVVAFLAATFLYAPLGVQAQTSASQSSTSAHGERWLHVRVISTNSKGETVRVNVPLEMAEKVLPAIDHDRLHNGKVRIGCMDCDGVDIRTIFEAVRSSKDGEFVTRAEQRCGHQRNEKGRDVVRSRARQEQTEAFAGRGQGSYEGRRSAALWIQG